MSNIISSGIAALPTIVKALRAQIFKITGAFDGSDPQRLRISHNDTDGTTWQAHSSLTETAASRVWAVYRQNQVIGSDTPHASMTYDGDLRVDGLTVDEAATFAALITASAGLTLTAPLTFPNSAGYAPTTAWVVGINSTTKLIVYGDGTNTHVVVDNRENQSIGGIKTFTGELIAPSSASPSQTTDGSLVYDTANDVPTWGTGASRRSAGYVGATVPSAIAGTGSAGSGFEVSLANHVHAGASRAHAVIHGSI
jgi:hypothetical protein